jgi:hypothetical protein
VHWLYFVLCFPPDSSVTSCILSLYIYIALLCSNVYSVLLLIYSLL